MTGLRAPRRSRKDQPKRISASFPNTARRNSTTAATVAESSHDLGDLQRRFGNQAVQRMLQRKGANGDSPTAGLPVPIQRKISYTFIANVGFKAKTTGMMKVGLGAKADHNTAFSHIMDAYRRYENAQDIKGELAGLHAMIALCKNYVEKYEGKNLAKDYSAQNLLKLCETELPNTNYMVTLEDLPSGLHGVKNATKDPLMAAHSDLVALRGDKEAYEEKLKIKADFFGKEVADSILFYADLLTPAERAALNRYTDQQYKFINPALAGNAGWLRSMVEGYNAEQNEKRAKGDSNAAPLPPEVLTDLKQTMDQNRAIGEMTASALRKLPSLKEGTLFRGETFTSEEGDALRQVGAVKSWPHLVSTSKDEGVSSSFARAATGDRPEGILFKISKHINGKDIKMLSSVASEGEILFVPGTTIRVKSVIKTEALGTKGNYTELEVEEIPPRPTSLPRRRSSLSLSSSRK